MDRRRSFKRLAGALILVVGSLNAADTTGTFGLGIGATQGAGDSQGPWSFGKGERGVYGSGGCLDLTWQTARDGVFQVRPRMTWYSMGIGRPIQQFGGPVTAKVHGRSATCDLMFQYFRKSPTPFYFFVGPGAGDYTSRLIPDDPTSDRNRAILVLDVGLGMTLARRADLELRYSNAVSPLAPWNMSFSWGDALDDSPNFVSLVLRIRL